jgi:hypothetical protein
MVRALRRLSKQYGRLRSLDMTSWDNLMARVLCELPRSLLSLNLSGTTVTARGTQPDYKHNVPTTDGEKVTDNRPLCSCRHLCAVSQHPATRSELRQPLQASHQELGPPDFTPTTQPVTLQASHSVVAPSTSSSPHCFTS